MGQKQMNLDVFDSCSLYEAVMEAEFRRAVRFCCGITWIVMRCNYACGGIKQYQLFGEYLAICLAWAVCGTVSILLSSVSAPFKPFFVTMDPYSIAFSVLLLDCITFVGCNSRKMMATNPGIKASNRPISRLAWMNRCVMMLFVRYMLWSVLLLPCVHQNGVQTEDASPHNRLQCCFCKYINNSMAKCFVGFV